jgi:hypothetical protein
VKTIEQCVAVFLRRLEAIKDVPKAVAEVAHTAVMAGAPVYTGTYQGAIRLELVKGVDLTGLSVNMTAEALLASAASSQSWYQVEHGWKRGESPAISPQLYAYGEAVPPKTTRGFTLEMGSEPYPLRIERIGSPKFDQGQDNWQNAAGMAGAVFAGGFAAAVNA